MITISQSLGREVRAYQEKKRLQNIKESTKEKASKKELKEAEVIVKNPEPGEVEASGYANILKEVAKELTKDIPNVEISTDDISNGDWAGITVIAKPTVEVPSEDNILFGLGVSPDMFGAPGEANAKLPEDARFLQFTTSEDLDNGEVTIEQRFSANTPIPELKDLFVSLLTNKEPVNDTIKKIRDLSDIVDYRADNNITDSEDVKESEEPEVKETEEVKESVNVHVAPDGSTNVSITEDAPIDEPTEEVIDEPVEEVENTDLIGDSEELCEKCGKPVAECSCGTSDDKKSITKEDEEIIDEIEPAGSGVSAEEIIDEPAEPTEEEVEEASEGIAADVIDSVVAKLESLGKSDLAEQVKSSLSISEPVEPEEFEECEITSYNITRIAPKSNTYMIEAQTKDGLVYITGKNFDKETNLLDEAEISNNKTDASNRFKKLMKGE